MNSIYIKETDEVLFSEKSKFIITWSKDDRTRMEKLHRHHSDALKTRTEALSSFVKLILENTYLYINNSEKGLSADINKLLEKSYYADVDKKFVELLNANSKERDFLIELIRLQTLKTISHSESNMSDEKEFFEFRLANGDTDLKRMISGSIKYMSFNEYISSLVQYFLNCPGYVQREIVYYRKLMVIDDCIRQQRIIYLAGRKYRPLKIVKSNNLAPGREIICTNVDNNEIVTKNLLMALKCEVRGSYEMFEKTSYEVDALQAFKDAEKIVIKYRINDKEKFSDHFMFFDYISMKEENGRKIIRMNMNHGFIRFLKECEAEGVISGLEFDKNYYNYVKYFKIGTNLKRGM